ncbi:hypothetical protein GGI07_001460 [Coemansia sp. Benny D115]|nr:hypothetical protein GGI07_001460 [Coemansia sp. Benny D115]
MYDYVRRQQELQPNIFTSKTFHWMEGSSREQPRQPSWTRMYSKAGGTDPLTYSSSSLFTGPRPGIKPGGARSAIQRSAANLSPHRMLLTFRRHRQHSDAPARPPSGLSSTFIQRRRGFTAPSGSQPPVFSAVPFESPLRRAPLASASPGQRGNHEGSGNALLDAPITKTITPHSVAEDGAAEISPAAGTIPVSAYAGGGHYAAAAANGAQMPDPKHDEKEKGGLEEVLDDPSSFARPGPQLSSSFSPPLSPLPRTICHRARSLMHRVRSLKPGGHGPNHQQRRRRQHHHQEHAQMRSAGVPFTISSVLCTFDNGTLPRNTRNSRGMPHPMSDPSARGARGSVARLPAGPHSPPPPQQQQQHRSGPRGPPFARQEPGQRRLPRSPLANPLVLSDVIASDTEADEARKRESVKMRTADRVASASLSTSALVAAAAAAAAESSSDDDTVMCRSCSRYKGLELVVSCDAKHELCFGCVQNKVRDVLATSQGRSVRCPVSACTALVSPQALQLCLPPQRLRQLEANQGKGDRALEFARRSFGFRDRRRASKSADPIPQRATYAQSTISEAQSEEGFDAPVFVTDDAPAPAAASSALPVQNAPAAHAAPIKRNDPANGGLVQSMANLKLAEGPQQQQLSRLYRDPQRYSTSMPALATDDHSLASTSSSSLGGQSITPPLLSELTRVGQASADSVVIVATVAADSTVSLSPESVGSRLRRVPKAQENLGARVQSPDVFESSTPVASPDEDYTQLFDSPTFAQSRAVEEQQPTLALYDYANYDLDTYMQTPPRIQAASFASSSSPISWQQPPPPPPPQFVYSQTPAGKGSVFGAPAPTSSAFQPQLRDSTGWAAPEQQAYSGYTEDLMLNATLFETIRHKSSPSDDEDDSDSSLSANPLAPPRHLATSRPPMPYLMDSSTAATTTVTDSVPGGQLPTTPRDDDVNEYGLYIPTWRRPEAASREQPMPLWTSAEFGSQSGVLCEAAELNFNLYETLRKKR